jgi:lysophospholipid acyltransferase (LPLAT)-like uncharacterized protein
MNDTPERPVASSHPRQLTWWRRLLLAVAAPVLAWILRGVFALFRVEVLGEASYRAQADAGQPVVFAFWHEGLLVVCWYIKQLLKDGVRATFLISPSVDGEIGVQILAQFGIRAVRGSARRSGAAALRRLDTAIREDRQSPCITLDGSKGPRRYCKPGAIMVARMADVPIVPIGFAARRAWRFPSWDRHLVPYPFSRVVIVVGEPYTVPQGREAGELEQQRRDLEDRVNGLMGISEERVGVRADARMNEIERTGED